MSCERRDWVSERENDDDDDDDDDNDNDNDDHDDNRCFTKLRKDWKKIWALFGNVDLKVAGREIFLQKDFSLFCWKE